MFAESKLDKQSNIIYEVSNDDRDDDRDEDHDNGYYEYCKNNWYPLNLEEICISNYVDKVYDNIISNILNINNKISNFSLLEINNSQYDNVTKFLNNFESDIIKSINKNRLNYIVFKNIQRKMSNITNLTPNLNLDINVESDDLDNMYAFLNTYPTPTVHRHVTDKQVTSTKQSEDSLIKFFKVLSSNASDNINQLVVKVNFCCENNILVNFKKNRDSKETEKEKLFSLWLNNYHDEKRVNSIVMLIDNCFKYISKLIKKIDELMIIIGFEFPFSLVNKRRQDFINFDSIIKSRFLQLQLYQTQFRSVIDTNGEEIAQLLTPPQSDDINDYDGSVGSVGNRSRYQEYGKQSIDKFAINIDRQQRSRIKDYHFRLIFQSNNYRQDGGYSGPFQRLYSCPKCDCNVDFN